MYSILNKLKLYTLYFYVFSVYDHVSLISFSIITEPILLKGRLREIQIFGIKIISWVL